MVESSLQLIDVALTYLTSFLGFNTMYTLPVFILVALISRFSSLRERFPNYGKTLLGLLAFLCGILIIALFENYDSYKLYLRNGFMLGASSALTYQIFKPVFKALTNGLFKKVNDKLGSDIEDDDLLI